MSMGRARTIALLSALFGALALAGCGSGEKLIPADQASSLDSALQQVSEATSAGDCARALSELQSAQAAFARLPRSVDERLVARIKDGLDQLAATVGTECEEARARNEGRADATTVTTGPQTTTTTEPETTTTTTTTQPETTTTPTTTTTTAPATTTGDPGGVSPDQPQEDG